MKFKKIAGAVGALALAGVALAGVTSPAQATDGQQFLGATSLPAPGGLLGDVSASTAFTPTTSYAQAHYPGGDGSMYDPGTYAVGFNPNNLHEFWADWSGNTTPTLFVNGFVGTDDQKVYEKVVQTEPCTTPGSNVSFTFSANAANIVDPKYIAEFDDGGLISVTINGTSIGSANLSGTSAAATISITGLAPVSNGDLDVVIWNNGKAYSGNDFGISNLSLVQNGTCLPPCVETADTHQWFNFNGNLVGTPALDDPRWHATEGNPRSANHKWENHTDGLPYFVSNGSKGKGDWFKWVTTEGHHCPVA